MTNHELYIHVSNYIKVNPLRLELSKYFNDLEIKNASQLYASLWSFCTWFNTSNTLQLTIEGMNSFIDDNFALFKSLFDGEEK